MHRFVLGAAFLAATALVLPTTASAQDDDPALTRWVFQGEFTSVLSQGNSESFTAGIGAVVRRRWEKDALRFEVGGIRTESSRITRRAVGTLDDFVVQVSSDSEKTAESVFVRSRYDRTLNDRFFTYGAVDWLRNTFAGIESRFVLSAGAGNTWIDTDTQRFKTNYGVTYTVQKDVVERPDADSNYPGARLGWEYWNRLTETSTFDSVLLVDLNLSDTDDVRYDLTNSLAVNISEKLALKPSLQFLYSTRPSLTSVSLFTAGDVDTGDTVLTELEKLDTFFRLALVLTL